MLPTDFCLECMAPGGVSGYVLLSGDRVVALKPAKIIPSSESVRVEFEPYEYQQEETVLASRTACHTSFVEYSTIKVLHTKGTKGDKIQISTEFFEEVKEDPADWWKGD